MAADGPKRRKKGGAAASYQEQGLSGLNRSAQGTVEEEFLPNLQGRKAIEAYREMSSNDPTVGGTLFAIDSLLRGVDWTAEGDDETSEEDVEFLEQCKDDMSHSFGDFISEALTMLPYGFSFAEIVYKQRQGPQDDSGKVAGSRYSDGKIGWRKFAFRSQDSLDHWEFDDQGGVQSFVQKAPPDFTEVTLPLAKGLLFRTTSAKGNPEGKSILRNAYRPWYYKKRIEEIEATGIERDLAGLPIAYVDPAILRSDASQDEKAIYNAIDKILRNIKRDKEEGIMWPTIRDESGNMVYDLKLLSSGGSRQFDTSAIINRYDQRITMTVLADFILLGHEKVGSFALSSDKTDLFAVALGAFLDVIEDVLNRYAIPRLFALNGLDLEHLPRLVHGDIESQDLAAVATYVGALVSAGVPLFPDDQLEGHLRKIGGLPEKSQDAMDQTTEEAEDEPAEEPEVPDELAARRQRRRRKAPADDQQDPDAAAELPS